MRILFLILLSTSSLLHADVIEEMLERIEQEYQSEAPDFEVIRKHVGELQDTIVQRTYPLQRTLRWWNQPEADLVAEVEKIAGMLAPYEEMLINLAHYEGIQQGYASTLTLLKHARPTETLKAAMEHYLFGDYSKGVPERSLDVLCELNLADDLLWERLFREIGEREKYRSQDFRTLRMLASHIDPVPGFADTLLDFIRKRIEKISDSNSRDNLELSDIVMSYSKMIDGMGIEMLPVAIELKKWLEQLMNGPHRKEVLAVYPHLEEQFNSILKRIRKDIRIEVPPYGYGLIARPMDISSYESKAEVVQVDIEITHSVPAIKEPNKAVTVEPSLQPAAPARYRWLGLLGLCILLIAILLRLTRR